jgi:hypothetical protein
MPLIRSDRFPTMSLEPMRLYLNDLENLHSVLAEHCETVQYTCKGFTADRPSELVGLKDQFGKSVIGELSIVGRFAGGEFIYVKFVSGIEQSRIDGSTGKREVAGVGARMKDLLDVRRRLLAVRVLAKAFWLITVFAPTVAVVFAWVSSRLGLLSTLVGLWASVGAFLVLWGFLTWACYAARGTRIHLYPRSQHRGLFDWSDYRGWIGTAIGSVLGALGILLIQWLGHLLFK